MTRATTSRPVLERLGLRFFRRRDERLQDIVPDDDIHVLNERERQALRRVQRGAVLRAGGVGALSAGFVAAAELYGLPALGLTDQADDSLRFYAALLILSAAAAALEIAYLYFDALRSVHNLARAAGLNVRAHGDEEEVALALARAALELPDPREPVFGVDPNREVSGWRLLAASALYKAKIAVSSFALKVLLRRALGRALVRSWLPFVAVPVTALWNIAICFKVLKEARLRVMGPSAVQALLDEVTPQLSPQAKQVTVRAVAATIVKKHRLHPNHLVLLAEVHRRLGVPQDLDIDDPEAFLQSLHDLPAEDAQPVLRIFEAALILDGRLSRRDQRLLEAAALRGPCPGLEERARALRHAFVHGHGLPQGVSNNTDTPMADRARARV